MNQCHDGGRCMGGAVCCPVGACGHMCIHPGPDHGGVPAVIPSDDSFQVHQQPVQQFQVNQLQRFQVNQNQLQKVPVNQNKEPNFRVFHQNSNHHGFQAPKSS